MSHGSRYLWYHQVIHIILTFISSLVFANRPGNQDLNFNIGSGFNREVNVVKIQSESSGAANTGAKDDEKFKEWERLLNTYKDVISEMQARLQ